MQKRSRRGQAKSWKRPSSNKLRQGEIMERFCMQSLLGVGASFGNIQAEARQGGQNFSKKFAGNFARICVFGESERRKRFGNEPCGEQ